MAADFSTQDLVEESVRRRFEAAWRAGTPVAIESVLPPADAAG